MSNANEKSSTMKAVPVTLDADVVNGGDFVEMQTSNTNDVIILTDLTMKQTKTITTTATEVTTAEELAQPTATTKNLLQKVNVKRPANLTLNILPATTETEKLLSNATPSNAASTSRTAPAAAATTTTTTIFPYEQYKTIRKLSIAFENVVYSTKVGFFKRVNKDILVGLSGCYRSGELNAIVGPSGAGKSTLLNVLSGYTYKGYTGEFRVNDRPRDLKTLKSNVAFITQDTSLQPFLTVKEAMHFSAQLKIGAHMSQAAKQTRVRNILEAIGMYESRHTRTDVLSGGQKKRLAIALELVNNPPVLMLDEPTSGLDSSISNQLITLLKKLALEGRTIICTIHQPSALAFDMFDHLYAIAEGQCIYAGATHSLLPFLAELGLICPQSYNPIDYLMEIATHAYGAQNHKLVQLMENGRNNAYRRSKNTQAVQLAAMQRIDKMMCSGLLTPVTAPVLTSGAAGEGLNFQLPPPPSANDRRVNKQLTPINEVPSNTYDMDKATPVGEQSKLKKKKSLPKMNLDPTQLCHYQNVYATPFHRQLRILLLRTFLIIWRDSSLTTMRFIIHLAVGLLIGVLYYDIGNDAGNALNNFRYAFYSIMFVMYCAFSGILVKFPLEFPIVSREHFNRWYSLRAYYVAITLADIPIQIICTSLFIFPTYFMTGQPLEWLRFGLFFLIVFLTALVAQSIGLAAGAGLGLELGAILGPFFICPFLQFSGFFLQEKDAPVYLRWIFDISFLRYSLDGAMLAIFGYGRERLDCKDIYCHYTRPQFLLKDLDLTRANYHLAATFMFGLFLFVRIIAFYVMSFRLRLFK